MIFFKHRSHSLLYKILLSFGFIFLILAFFVCFSSWPTVWAVRYVFGKTEYTKSADYEVVLQNVKITQDVDYKSAYSNGVLDIFYPKSIENQKPIPLILWVHGGAFVAGDKNDVKPYMVLLANQGYAVASINYALAPAEKYPVQLKQLDEALTFLQTHKDTYLLDMDHVFLGGDSAGAQMVAQYVAIQTNDQYRQRFNEYLGTNLFIQRIEQKNIAGVLLMCGPYDMSAFTNQPLSPLQFVITRVGEAYYGREKWADGSGPQTSTVYNHITSNFVPTFITDGNTHSFESHARKLESTLKLHGVRVSSIYFGAQEALTGHEYQFNMASPQAQIVFLQVQDFLKSTLNKHRNMLGNHRD